MNIAAVAADLAQVDDKLCELLLQLEALRSKLPPASAPAIAVQHALDTVALLSQGFECMVIDLTRSTTEHPSWN